MSAIAPVDAESCRAMAVECGRRANDFIVARQYAKAGKELVSARKLTLRALELEQEQNSAGKASEQIDPSTGHVSPPVRSRYPGSGSANIGGKDVTDGRKLNTIKDGPNEGKNSLAARECEKSLHFNPPSDGDEISEVKGMARPENAAGVEPSPSEIHSSQIAAVNADHAQTVSGGNTGDIIPPTNHESDGPKSRPEAVAKSAAHIDTLATGKTSAQERSSDRSGGQFGDAPKPAQIPGEVA